jgi:phosphatidylserine/phosphatidylglycerophosphate/cardiolipin synthase-like enzyme
MRLTCSVLFLSVALICQTANAETIFSANGEDCEVGFISHNPLASPNSINTILQSALHAIGAAENSIDLVSYDLDHPLIVDALLAAASRGVAVRIILDSKFKNIRENEGSRRASSFRNARRSLIVEKLLIGLDKVPETSDDISLLSDAPIPVIEDAPLIRRFMGLPEDTDYLAAILVSEVNANSVSLVPYFVGPDLGSDNAYSPATLAIHSKFLVVDDQTVLTTSANFTLSGLGGFDVGSFARLGSGYRDQAIQVYSGEFSSVYSSYFDRLWGPKLIPDSQLFRKRSLEPTYRFVC